MLAARRRQARRKLAARGTRFVPTSRRRHAPRSAAQASRRRPRFTHEPAALSARGRDAGGRRSALDAALREQARFRRGPQPGRLYPRAGGKTEAALRFYRRAVELQPESAVGVVQHRQAVVSARPFRGGAGRVRRRRSRSPPDDADVLQHRARRAAQARAARRVRRRRRARRFAGGPNFRKPPSISARRC